MALTPDQRCGRARTYWWPQSQHNAISVPAPTRSRSARGSEKSRKTRGVAADADARDEPAADVGDAGPGGDDRTFDLGPLDIRAGADRGIRPDVRIGDLNVRSDHGGTDGENAPANLRRLRRSAPALRLRCRYRSTRRGSTLSLFKCDLVEFEKVERIPDVSSPVVRERDVEPPASIIGALGERAHVDALALPSTAQIQCCGALLHQTARRLTFPARRAHRSRRCATSASPLASVDPPWPPRDGRPRRRPASSDGSSGRAASAELRAFRGRRGTNARFLTDEGKRELDTVGDGDGRIMAHVTDARR